MESSTVVEQAKCLRCGRTLTATSSITAGYGRICRARIRAAALAEALRDFTAAQIDKARELIADGALVPMRAGVWQASSSDGSSRYLVAWQTCSCPAGIHGRRCYHVAAARMVAAGRTA
jgi:hypothetical protein